MRDRQASSTTALGLSAVPASRRWMRYGFWALRAATLLFLLCLLALGCTAFWLHRNPQALATHLAEAIEQRTGIQCSLGTVDVVLLPVPSLGIADVHVQAQDMTFSAAFATVRPALLPLLQGQFTPGSITLLRPALTHVLPPKAEADTPPPAPQSAPPLRNSEAAPLELPTQTWLAELEKSLPQELHGMSLQVLQGSLLYDLDSQRTLSIDTISADLRLYSGGPVGSLSLGQSVVRQKQEVIASLDALHLTLGGQWLRVAQGADAKVSFDTRLHVPGFVQGLQLSLNAAQKTSLSESSPHWEAQANMQGSLLWASTASAQSSSPPFPLPLSVRGNMRGSLEKGLLLENVHMALADDRLSAQAQLTLTASPSTGQIARAERAKKAVQLSPRLTGTLDIQRLSLSQWFGFARRLPPGLQRTLHQVQGSLNFDITPQGLTVPHLSVSTADGTFSGTGGVPLWTRPVVTLDLAAPTLTLSKALPEAEGQDPAPLVFAHAPLTPEPGTEAAKAMSGPDIDYDIQIRVAKLTGWQLQLGEVHFRCIPGAWGAAAGKKGAQATAKNGDASTLMTFGAGHIYGGKGEGQLLLTTPAPGKTGYAVKANLRNINMEPVLARLTAVPGKSSATASTAPLAGRLNLDTEFTAQGRTLAAFFASQDGILQIRLDNGHVLADVDKKEKWPFTLLRLEARARGEQGQSTSAQGRSRLPAELVYTGQWKFLLEAPRLKGSYQMEGPVAFSSAKLLPVQWRKAPGHLTLEANRSLLVEKGILPLPEGQDSGEGMQKADISGRFSLHSEERSFAVDEAHISLPGLGGVQLKGHMQGATPPQGAWVEGELQGHANSARTLLRHFLPSAASSLPATTLHKAQGQARVAYRDKSLSLNDLHFKVDEVTASGWISGIWKDRPAWRFNLDMGTLDMDAYMPPRKASHDKDKKPAQAATPLPWDLRWMKELDASGQVHIQNLRVRKLSLHNLSTPVHLQDGTLDCAPLRAELYGAPLASSFKAEAKQGLKLLFNVEAQGMDMRALSTDRHMQTLLGGQGSLWATVQGTARSGADIPAALDGSWRVQIGEAYTQPSQAKGTASRSVLGEITASGPMNKGELRSDNFTILSPTMQGKGGGWVNLDKDTLDVSLTMKMYRIPEFPVRYYGSLDDPQRSINAGKAITSTLGNLGSGVVDVLGNIIGGALRILP